MNKLLKTLLLAVYAVLMFGLVIILANTTNKPKRFSEYKTIPYDDNISLNVQVMEIRQSKEETGTDYEYSKYDVYFIVTKRVDASISGMNAYIANDSGKEIKYQQSASEKTMAKTTKQVTNFYILNSSLEFAYNKITVEEEKVTHDNQKPETLYIKLVYDIVYTSDEDAEPKTCELNYKFDYKDVDATKFVNYEKRDITGNYIDYKDDPIKIKLVNSQSESNNITKNNFKVSIVDVNKAGLGDKKIDKIDLQIFGEVTNLQMVNEKYFSKYIKFFTYNGAIVEGTAISTSRTSAFNADYNVEKIYVTATISYTDGSNSLVNYYVNLSELAKS